MSQIVVDMKFFKVFDHNVRMKLLFISHHKLFQAKERVISSENLEETIVVVISGVLTVVITDEKIDGKFVRQTLYPGDSIGGMPTHMYLQRKH